MRRQQLLGLIGRAATGIAVVGVWTFSVVYTTIYSGTTSWWIHIGAGIVLAAVFPEAWERVLEVIKARWGQRESVKSEDSQNNG